LRSNRSCDRVAVTEVPPGLRPRRERDERAAVAVAGRDELVRRVLAQQLDVGGVDAIGDRERAAQVAGRLGEAHLRPTLLGRPEGYVPQTDLIGFDATPLPGEDRA